MKKWYVLFFLFLICLMSVAAKKTVINNFPLFGKLIILDPGHGGLDPGSVYKDEYEKDYNLKFSQTLKKNLEKYGATVIMTREGDYDLSSPNTSYRKRSDFDNRIKLIDNSKADLYLSLHMNSLNDNKYFGSQSFYSSVNKNNKILAEILQNNFNRFFNYNKNYKVIDNSKYMYKNISTVGVLIEYGFITNYKDRKNLKNETYRLELSEVISQSVIEYFT